MSVDDDLDFGYSIRVSEDGRTVNIELRGFEMYCKETSKLTGWEKDITVIAFGYGAIKVGTASWPDNQHMLILCDTEKKHSIGTLDNNPDNEFFKEAVEVIGLGFNDPRSVDVVIDLLNAIKKRMAEFTDAKEKSHE